MSSKSTLFPFAAALAFTALSPAVAVARQAGTPVQQQDARQAANLRARIDATDARIAVARRSRAITRARATALGRQVAQTRRSMTRLSAQQGFVSAAEFASYDRTLGAIDTELDGRGVARSYGNDMLMAHGK